MKPIFLSDDEKQKLAAEIMAKLAKSKMFDGKLDFKYNYEYEKNKHPNAKLWYTPEAWAKMTALVDIFSGEVGWHGVIERIAQNEWVVSDILVYPQYVTAAHVDTDEEEFHAWWMEQMEFYDGKDVSLNYQGHSHVNMAVSPSATDLQDQQNKMADMKRGFYVFTIQNKRRESKTWIYDYDNNIAYMPGDIDIDVMIDTTQTLMDFMSDAKDMVINEKYTTPAIPQKAPVNASKKDVKHENIYNDVYPYVAKGYSYDYDC